MAGLNIYIKVLWPSVGLNFLINSSAALLTRYHTVMLGWFQRTLSTQGPLLAAGTMHYGFHNNH